MDDREGSFLSFRPRERAKRVTEWRNLARRVSVNKRLAFLYFHSFEGTVVCRAVFGRARRSRQDPSAWSLRSLGRDDKDGFYFQRSFDSLRSLRMTGRDPAHHAASRHSLSAPARSAARGCYKLSIAPIILEKAKTALFAFSPCSEEMHAERVNLRGVYQS